MSQKVSKYFSALSRTTYSTWGLPVLTAHHVYTAILRSLLSYAAGVWFNPQKKPSNIISLSTFQNKYLRTIGGVFKATLVFLLESELFLLSLDLYFKLRTACFLLSFYSTNTLPNSFSTLLHKLHSRISFCSFSQNYTKVSDNYFSKLENSLAETTNHQPRPLKEESTESFLQRIGSQIAGKQKKIFSYLGYVHQKPTEEKPQYLQRFEED